MIDLGTVRPGTKLYIPFATYDSNDPSASVTLTGLATTDIEIYKDGSTTQRASDSGYALLDTDGIDFDGITGIHGFSIDLADNDTAGFYAAGSQYWVVVSSVTVDGATINFIAATFRIGYPDAILNTTIATLASQTSFTLTEGPADDGAMVGMVCVVHDVASSVQRAQGVVSAYTGSTKTVTLAVDPGIFTMAATDNIAFFPGVNVRYISEDKTAADNEELFFDGTGYAGGTTRLKIDLDTIKTQAITCGAGVTIRADVGAAAAPGAANGMLIGGSNAATTFATLTSTGAFTCGSTALGNTTMGSLTQTGAVAWGATTFASVAITGAFSVGTTTTLTGAVSLGSTLGVTGTTTFAAINAGAVGMTTLATSGTTTLNALTVTGTLSAATVSVTTTGLGTTTLGATTIGTITQTGATSWGAATVASYTCTGAETWGSWVVTAANAYPLLSADSGATYVARAPSGTQTLDSLAASIAGIGSGTGAALNFACTTDSGETDPLNSVSKVGTVPSATEYLKTTADNAVYEVITAAGSAIDWVYKFSVGSGRVASKVTFNGYLLVAGPVGTKAVNVYAWNFTGTPAWNLVGVIAGQTGTTDITRDITLLSAHTGTGTDAGVIYLRFTNSGAVTSLNVDALIAQAQNLGQNAGYTGGYVYLDTTGGGTSGTTPFVNGIESKPCTTIAEAYSIAAAVGVRGIYLTPGSSATLTQSAQYWKFYGGTISLASQSIADALFENCYTVQGVSSGDDYKMIRCGVGTMTGAHGYFWDCAFKGTFTMLSGGQAYYLFYCSDGTNAATACSFVFAANAEFMARGWTGGINLDSMSSTNTAIIDGAGRITIADTSVGGSLTIRGAFPEIVGGAGYHTAAEFIAHGGTVSDTARMAEDQNIGIDWSNVSNQTSIVGLSGTTIIANVTQIDGDATPIDGKAIGSGLQYIAAAVAGKVSGAGTGTEKFYGLDGTTERVRVTADTSGNRTDVTYDPV